MGGWGGGLLFMLPKAEVGLGWEHEKKKSEYSNGMEGGRSKGGAHENGGFGNISWSRSIFYRLICAGVYCRSPFALSVLSG